ncbi:MAG: sugar phosphate isomerase/epimerase family protein [Planctomycetia bacterium]|nr:sugar phosphate isomerase/epimerase family protein [Planctomycetia bacterium]
MHFKYAMCNELYENWDLARQFDYVARCGYTGMELAPFTLTPSVEPADVREITPAKIAEIRRCAKNSGVGILGLHWLLSKTSGFHLTLPDADVRKKTVAYGKALIDLCSELGGNIMVWGSPKQRNIEPGVSRDDAFRYAADALSELAPKLVENNVSIALEPLAPAETNFLTNAAETVQLIEMVECPNIQLHLDCKAMWGGELAPDGSRVPMADVIRRFAPYTIHFHANDPNLQGPGMGELDFTPIFAALQETHYKGWISVEVFDYTPGPEALTEKSIAYMKKIEAACNP